MQHQSSYMTVNAEQLRRCMSEQGCVSRERYWEYYGRNIWMTWKFNRNWNQKQHVSENVARIVCQRKICGAPCLPKSLKYTAHKKIKLKGHSISIWVYICASVCICVHLCLSMSACEYVYIWANAGNFSKDFPKRNFCFYSFAHIVKTGSGRELWSPSTYVDACECVSLSVLY